jgi:hypothetical protein
MVDHPPPDLTSSTTTSVCCSAVPVPFTWTSTTCWSSTTYATIPPTAFPSACKSSDFLEVDLLEEYYLFLKLPVENFPPPPPDPPLVLQEKFIYNFFHLHHLQM